MWVEITERKNLGTSSKPCFGFLFQREVDGSPYVPEAGIELVTSGLGRYRARRRPEWGNWVELEPIDGAPPGGPKDYLEVPDTPDETMDLFHAHLDKCRQCREHPFGLCPEGDQLLRQGV